MMLTITFDYDIIKSTNKNTKHNRLENEHMSRFELDTYRRIERGDIFYVKLSETDRQSLEGMGMLLGKIRPCLVVTTDKYNKQAGQCLYTVIPLKTYVEDVTKIDDE